MLDFRRMYERDSVGPLSEKFEKYVDFQEKILVEEYEQKFIGGVSPLLRFMLRDLAKCHVWHTAKQLSKFDDTRQEEWMEKHYAECVENLKEQGEK